VTAEVVTAPALEMRGITKRYPGVVANDGIDLQVRPGEIHALLGENGAGKSTLMNILYGLATPDEGEIALDGKPVQISGPSDAITRGISMVHQHFMLVPVLSVADNILLGEETMANPIFLDRNEAHRRIIELGKRFGFDIDPEVKVGSLSVGWQQRVEILKALYREARILVLDEPTAVLTPQETKEIFEVLRRLAAEGHSIIFISHKLYEVLEIADTITGGARWSGSACRQRPMRTTSPRSWSGATSNSSSIVASRTRPSRGSSSRTCASPMTGDMKRSRASASTCAPVRSSALLGLPATVRTSSSRP
jgi:ABC-type sugar transport system ATPase subunit